MIECKYIKQEEITCTPREVREVRVVRGVVRDLAKMKQKKWGCLVHTVNKTFKNVTIALNLFRNSLRTPAMRIRYELIREYHKSVSGELEGITKTCARLSTET